MLKSQVQYGGQAKKVRSHRRTLSSSSSDLKQWTSNLISHSFKDGIDSFSKETFLSSPSNEETRKAILASSQGDTEKLVIIDKLEDEKEIMRDIGGAQFLPSFLRTNYVNSISVNINISDHSKKHHYEPKLNLKQIDEERLSEENVGSLSTILHSKHSAKKSLRLGSRSSSVNKKRRFKSIEGLHLVDLSKAGRPSVQDPKLYENKQGVIAESIKNTLPIKSKKNSTRKHKNPKIKTSRKKTDPKSIIPKKKTTRKKTYESLEKKESVQEQEAIPEKSIKSPKEPKPLCLSTNNMKYQPTSIKSPIAQRPKTHRRTHSDANSAMKSLNYSNTTKRDKKGILMKISQKFKSPRSAFRDLKWSSTNDRSLKSDKYFSSLIRRISELEANLLEAHSQIAELSENNHSVLRQNNKLKEENRIQKKIIESKVEKISKYEEFFLLTETNIKSVRGTPQNIVN